MKKSILITLSSILLGSSGFAQSSWRMGLMIGSVDNRSVYSGGMETANARFHHEKFNTGMIGLSFRKTYNEHWSLQTGIQFSSIGFKYSIGENYSLLAKHPANTNISTSAGTVNIPLTVLYHFKPNCKNVRWYVGLGISLLGNGAVNEASGSVSALNEGSSNTTSNDYLYHTTVKKAGAAFNGHFVFGREKTFNSGRTLGIGFIGNIGTSPLMYSTVNYTIDGTIYNHSFTNYGSYAGIEIHYLFRNFSGNYSKKPPVKDTNPEK